MTKWHKYRDFKPSIKNIITSKEKSDEKVRDRRAKTHAIRVFIKFNFDECDKSNGLDKLDIYRLHSKKNSPFWIPAPNFFIENSSEYLLEDMKEQITSGKLVWLYLFSDNHINNKDFNNKVVRFKSKIIDLSFAEEKRKSPEILSTLIDDLHESSNLWLKISSFKNCGGVSIEDLILASSKTQIDNLLQSYEKLSLLVEKN